MTIHICGHRSYGSSAILGEDENGNLYSGVVQRIPWTSITRTVTANVDGQHLVSFAYGDTVVASATLAEATEPGLYIPSATETVPVIDWTPL